MPTGDAPCPSCGSLLWFVVRESDVFFFETPATVDRDITTAPIPAIGARVRIADGTFENFEGDVIAVDNENDRITTIVNIFGRPTPIELEVWQVEWV